MNTTIASTTTINSVVPCIPYAYHNAPGKAITGAINIEESVNYASSAKPPSPRGSLAPPTPTTRHWTLLK